MMAKEGAVYARTLLLQAPYTSVQYCLEAPEVVDPHSEADLVNAVATWEATLVEVDLKYSFSFAVLERAAVAAA